MALDRRPAAGWLFETPTCAVMTLPSRIGARSTVSLVSLEWSSLMFRGAIHPVPAEESRPTTPKCPWQNGGAPLILARVGLNLELASILVDLLYLRLCEESLECPRRGGFLFFRFHAVRNLVPQCLFLFLLLFLSFRSQPPKAGTGTALTRQQWKFSKIGCRPLICLPRSKLISCLTRSRSHHARLMP